MQVATLHPTEENSKTDTWSMGQLLGYEVSKSQFRQYTETFHLANIWNMHFQINMCLKVHDTTNVPCQTNFPHFFLKFDANTTFFRNPTLNS